LTPEQYELCQALGCCTYLPGSWDKRFARDLSARAIDYQLSEKQVEQLERMKYKYRRQLAPKLRNTLEYLEADVAAIAKEMKHGRASA
jgi:hypothetical protein